MFSCHTFCAIPDLGCVLAAVLKCAPHDWYSIDCQLGYFLGQLTDMTHTLGSGAMKLERIVDEKAAEVVAEEAAHILLDACERLINPVIGAVRMILEESHLP